MQNMPFPSNDHKPATISEVSRDRETMSWKVLQSREATPMCFELRLRKGEVVTFPYSDFRGIRLLNAGRLIVNVYAMEKTQIVVHGRHLGELAKHISLGRIQWFGEVQKKNYELPESCPHIDCIEFVNLK